MRRPRDEVRRLEVEALSRRVAHATHALLEASRELGMPPKASEVLVYDVESLSSRQTGCALHEASKYGLTIRVPGGLWLARERAHDLRSALEDRFLRETADEEDRAA